MATLTLSIHAEGREDLIDGLEEILTALGYTLDTDTDEDAKDDTPAAPADGGRVNGWDQKRMDKYLTWLTEDALTALVFIAENAPNVAIDDVINHLGLSDGRELGGRMSSLGHALRQMPRGLTSPVQRHYTRYEIDERIAAMVIAANNA